MASATTAAITSPVVPANQLPITRISAVIRPSKAAVLRPFFIDAPPLLPGRPLARTNAVASVRSSRAGEEAAGKRRLRGGVLPRGDGPPVQGGVLRTPLGPHPPGRRPAGTVIQDGLSRGRATRAGGPLRRPGRGHLFLRGLTVRVVRRRGRHRGQPLRQPAPLVHQVANVVFGVGELGGPEQRVERADL